MADIDNTMVTVGQPVDGGCAFISFADSPTLPTDAKTAMSSFADFESLGELSEDGYSDSHEISSTTHKGWHGKVLLTTVEEETFSGHFDFVEVVRASVLKLVYGPDNVEVDGDGNVIHYKAKAPVRKPVAIVVDELLSNGWKRRTVIRRADVTSIDETSHRKGDLMVYGVDFTFQDGTAGAYDAYLSKPPEEDGGGSGSGSGGSSDEDIKNLFDDDENNG